MQPPTHDERRSVRSGSPLDRLSADERTLLAIGLLHVAPAAVTLAAIGCWVVVNVIAMVGVLAFALLRSIGL